MKMKVLLILLSFASCIFLKPSAFTLSAQEKESETSKEIEKMSAKEIEEFAIKIDKALKDKAPIKLNRGVELQAPIKSGKTIIVLHLHTSAYFDKEELLASRSFIDNLWCKDDKYRNILLKNDYSFMNVIVHEAKKELEIRTTYKDCIVADVVDKYYRFLESLNDKEIWEFIPNKELFRAVYYERVSNENKLQAKLDNICTNCTIVDVALKYKNFLKSLNNEEIWEFIPNNELFLYAYNDRFKNIK